MERRVPDRFIQRPISPIEIGVHERVILGVHQDIDIRPDLGFGDHVRIRPVQVDAMGLDPELMSQVDERPGRLTAIPQPRFQRLSGGRPQERAVVVGCSPPFDVTAR